MDERVRLGPRVGVRAGRRFKCEVDGEGAPGILDTMPECRSVYIYTHMHTPAYQAVELEQSELERGNAFAPQPTHTVAKVDVGKV